MRLDLQAALNQDTLLTIPPLIIQNKDTNATDQPSQQIDNLNDESLIIKFNDDFNSNKKITSLNRIINDSDDTATHSDQTMDDDDD